MSSERLNCIGNLRTATCATFITAIMAVAALSTWQRGYDCPIENPKIDLKINGAKLQVEVAANSIARYCGLAFRDDLPADAGMLFVYSRNQTLDFWMKHTRFPLALAFVDEHQRITEILKMTPEMNEYVSTSSEIARFALETNLGWFAANGVKIGDRVSFALPKGLPIE